MARIGRMMLRRRPRPGRRRGGVRRRVVVVLTVFIIAMAAMFTVMDRQLLPAVLRIEEYRIYARINQAINDAVAALAYARGLEPTDFYTVMRDSDGRVLSLSANAILINEVGAQVSQILLEYLSSPQMARVDVPMGALFGVAWLANAGPSYRINVMPVGMANVDHHTSFTAAGINQTNFQVWLTVSATMQIVNPLQARQIDVTRTLPLVNTVFAGEIPGVYLGPGM